MSIFVNPTQFNEDKDFALYPRTLDQDVALLAPCAIDYLLIPDVSAMYRDNYFFQLTENELSHELEGKFRPGHFSGMLTIVLKLFNLVRATRAYLGEKDYQQFLYRCAA